MCSTTVRQIRARVALHREASVEAVGAASDDLGPIFKVHTTHPDHNHRVRHLCGNATTTQPTMARTQVAQVRSSAESTWPR